MRLVITDLANPRLKTVVKLTGLLRLGNTQEITVIDWSQYNIHTLIIVIDKNNDFIQTFGVVEFEACLQWEADPISCWYISWSFQEEKQYLCNFCLIKDTIAGKR